MVAFRSWGSFVAGDQSGDRGQDRVEVLASAEVTGQGPPVLELADAVLHAGPFGRVRLAFGRVCRGEGGWGRQPVLTSGRARG